MYNYMKLLKNTLEYLNYGIGSNNYNSEQFEWNMQPGGLYDDNRRKIVTKPMVENKPQSLEKGDKMRIPGVLDYTGAKYPFKKLIKKHETGTPIKYHWQNNARKQKEKADRERYLNEDPVYGEYQAGVSPDFKRKGLISNNKIVRLTDDGITVVSSKLGNNKVISEIRQLLPDPVARENLYKILDPKNPLYFEDTRDESINMRKNPKDTLENRLKKVAIIYKSFGNNGVVDTTNKDRQYLFIDGDREFVDPIKNTIMARSNNPWNVDTAVFQEIPHFKQMKNGINILSLIGGDLPNKYGLSGYDTYGSAENQAHNVYARAFEDFIFNPKYKTGKDLSNLIKYYSNESKKEYNQKIHQNTEHVTYSGMPITFKSGSKIHIKKKNRGKFTEYCGGNVTQDCINRAKRSGNKTLIKRAVFAENARHFKHRSGGQIVQESKLNNIIWDYRNMQNVHIVEGN